MQQQEHVRQAIAAISELHRVAEAKDDAATVAALVLACITVAAVAWVWRQHRILSRIADRLERADG